MVGFLIAGHIMYMTYYEKAEQQVKNYNGKAGLWVTATCATSLDKYIFNMCPKLYSHQLFSLDILFVGY